MKLYTVALIFVITGLYSATQVHAQSKIGTIDIGAIMSSLPESKQVNETVNTMSKNMNSRLVIKEKKFQEEIKNYNNKYTQLSQKQRADYEKKLAGLEEDLEKMQVEVEKQITKKQQELLKPLIEKIKKTIASVAKAKGYTHILNKEANGISEVVYALPSTDITKLVKAKLGVK